jgi:eukaryotic-like serine/threonine-protein kinase
MALRTGDRLGAYEIVALLGHGAMGEVYRARDTRLGRDVAVKVLPEGFADDADRLARFEREARVISQVNHPNVCTLFDIIEGTNAPSLILELVEGETLQQRLLRGPMPLREALRAASGIAGALEAAHRKGIIHRDLKPANIKITAAGTIKVLDFGVAKLAHPLDSESVADLTAIIGGTKEGVLVGTVAYMSPEQAMGERVDAKSDIWAFGCLLYEMLTARRAFRGVAVADTLGAVMRDEPDWAALPAETPPEVRTLLRRSVEKDRARRLADIRDARLEIDDLLIGGSAYANLVGTAGKSANASLLSQRGRVIVALAFVSGVMVASILAGVFYGRPEPSPAAVDSSPTVPSVSVPTLALPEPRTDALLTPPAVASTGTAALQADWNRATNKTSVPPPAPTLTFIRLPEGTRWARPADGPNTVLALSPDGRRVVFSARVGDRRTLWLRSLTADDAIQLPGTEGGVSPFWSPDSTAIGFFANGSLKRLDLGAPGTRALDRLGEPVTLCEARSQRGGTWGPDDTIVFSPASGGLKRISANGGVVTSLTSQEPGEHDHFRPQFFPGTRQLLYRVTSDNGRNNSYYATSLDSPRRTLIATLDSGNVVYAKSHLLYMQGHAIMAQPFDAKTLTVTGRPKSIANDVLLSTGSLPVFGVFSVSQTGRLVYLSEERDFDHPLTVMSSW